MINIFPDNIWLLVIDTDSYAGNFENDLCAYCTGSLGDADLGIEYADIYNNEVKEVDFFDNIMNLSDEHGWARPCTMFESSDGEENSIAIFFETKPTKEQIAMIEKRAYRFPEVYAANYKYGNQPPKIKIVGLHLLHTEVILQPYEF